MIGDVNFSDLIRIYQIRREPKRTKPVERNKNFEEFSDVYKEVFTNGLPDSSRLQPSYVGTKGKYSERYSKRSLHDVKKIRMEMPFLGAERAIVTAPKLLIQEKRPKRKTETQDKSLVTENRITKWTRNGAFQPTKVEKECGSLTSSLIDAHLFLQQTKQEIRESETQFQSIQSMISEVKPPEKLRKSKTPTFKAKRKPDRHSECLNKKYMSTLNTMQEKLQKLEEKYFGKPRVVYKNVRDICTTFSNIDILYRDNSSTADVDINETLLGIKRELDDMANSSALKEEKKPKTKTVTFKAPEVEFNTVGDTFDEDKNITPMNFSFKKPVNFDEEDEEVVEQVNYARVIDQSENFFKKYQFLTKDVENMYREINSMDREDNEGGREVKEERKLEEQDSRSVTDDSDRESHDSDVDKFYNEGNPFFSKDIQAVISSSSYLTKEFHRKQPNVKVFTNSDRFVHNRYLGVPSNTSTNIDPSIINLIDNLNLSLKDSIYYKPD